MSSKRKSGEQFFIHSEGLEPTAITESQHKALVEFKIRCKDIIKPDQDDWILFKWLKARNYSVDKAEEMFRNSVAYKEKMKVDTLERDFKIPEVLEKYGAGGFCGNDKEGSPVFIELYGHLDMKGLMHSVKKTQIEITKLLQGEETLRLLNTQMKKVGKHLSGMTVILDMENSGAWMLWGPGIQMYAHMGRILQDNYPEIVKRTFIINAPRIFPVLWNMFKPLVTQEMKQKVCILGGGYQKELLKHIDADELPAYLGGNMKDPDGNVRCPSKIKQGGKVPESYYSSELSDEANMKVASISRGDKHELKFSVEKPCSILRWEFKSDGYDCGFGLALALPQGKPEVLIPVERVNCHMVPEDGTYTCEKAGLYLVTFDNSYSWTKSKKVYYNIDVVPPDDVQSELDAVTYGGSWQRIADETEITHL